MPAELQPPELARLVDVAECSRTGDWSLRSALVRYAQPQPERVSQVLELVRRIEAALHAHTRLLVDEGPRIWLAVDAGGAPPVGAELLVGVLQAARELDHLADRLVVWAVDRSGERPDSEVDSTVARVTRALDRLGVAREERQAPPRSRG